MLQIQPETHTARNITIWLIILILLFGGAYILITAFSPMINVPVLSGREPHATEEKLTRPPIDEDRLYIPKINIDVAIVQGDNAAVLEKGAWHRKPENGDPVHGGNFVLSAHRFVMSFTPQGTAIKSPFYNIGKIQVGDMLYVDYKKVRYKYTVKEKSTVSPGDTAIENHTDNPQLTLYSCTLQGSSDGRDVIIAAPAQ